MFTDIVGFTALGQRAESLSLALLEEHRKLLRPVFARHGGKEIRTIGDAFLVEFVSALDAARCAYDVQRASREFNISLPDEKRVRLRVGVHLGDVVESQGDVLGDAVNVASRIQAFAEEGGVCLTQQVYDQVHNKLDVPLVSRGKVSLKNVSEPIEVYRMVMPWGEEKAIPPSQLDRRRIAVLPFYNMSTSPDDEYFADGMTEELITTLSKVGELSVISRTSVMPYRKAPKALKEVGKELQAGTIIEGSVRKAGQTFRITVQMLDAQNDRHIWADSYDRNLQDVFATQSEIANKVTETLRVRLVDSERARINKAPTENIDAYTFYLKGRQCWSKRDIASIREAIEYFRQAVGDDPNYAPGYSGLADCHFILAYNMFIEPQANNEAAKRFATKALELDSDLAEAHATLANIMENEFRFKESEVEFKKAISLKPSYASAHQWYGQLLSYQGRWEEAYSEINRAVELDPLSPIIWAVRADTYGLGTRNYAKWISDMKKIQETFPDFTDVHFNMIMPYAYNSMFKEALEEIEIGLSGYPEGVVSVFRAYIHAKAGEIDKARRILVEKADAQMKDSIPTTALAYTYLFMGEKDKAFELFERAYKERDNGMMTFRIEPDADGIKSDPRYLSLLEKIGL